MLRSSLLIMAALLAAPTLTAAAETDNAAVETDHAAAAETGNAAAETDHAAAAETGNAAAETDHAAAAETGNAAAETGNAAAETGNTDAETGSQAAPTVPELDQTSQDLLSDVLQLKGELLALRRDIQYPALDRWTVFVTRESGTDPALQLEHLMLSVDGKPIADEQYSATERHALQRGGADRLYLGTLKRGRHEATVTITGQYQGKPFKRTQSLAVNKRNGPHILRLRVGAHSASESSGTSRPGVDARQLEDLQ